MAILVGFEEAFIFYLVGKYPMGSGDLEKPKYATALYMVGKYPMGSGDGHTKNYPYVDYLPHVGKYPMGSGDVVEFHHPRKGVVKVSENTQWEVAMRSSPAR